MSAKPLTPMTMGRGMAGVEDDTALDQMSILKPSGYTVVFSIADDANEVDVRWSGHESDEQIDEFFTTALARLPQATQVEVQVSDPNGTLACVATILPAHLTALVDGNELSRWTARLAVLASRGHEGEPAYLVATMGVAGWQLQDMVIGINDDDRDRLIDAIPLSVGVPLAVRLDLPSGEHAIRSNWVLSNKLVLFGEPGMPMFAYGPYPSDAAARTAAASLVPAVTELRLGDGIDGPGPWDVRVFKNPLREAILAPASPATRQAPAEASPPPQNDKGT